MSDAAPASWAGLDRETGRLVVVGGGLATARLCTTLRRRRFAGPITVLSAESLPPYDRPPLTKEVLAGAKDSTRLPFDTEHLEVDLRLGTPAVGVSVERRVVLTESDEIPFDALAIATGADPVRLPGDGPQLTLRTLADAQALRGHLRPGTRIAVVGASWIGAEVATAARTAGCRVTCIEYGPAPLAGALGAEVGALTRPWWEEWEEIELRTDTAVDRIVGNGVRLSDGTVLNADAVVTGIGVRPSLAWLDGSGIEVDRGVLTDTRCRTNVPGVVALGDVAQRWSRHAGRHRLIEHWDEASTVAAAAAATLLDPTEGPEHDPVPYFWSDQFGHKIQYVGCHGADDTVRTEVDERGALARAVWSRDGMLTAWLGVDATRDVVKARMAVGGPVSAVE